MKSLLKKKSKYFCLILAMAMAMTSCFPINALASESVQNGQSMTFNYDIDIYETLFPYDSNMPIYPNAEYSHPLGDVNMVYFYNLFNKTELFTCSADVYAYKLRVTVSDVSNNSRGLQTLNFCYGNDNHFATLDDINCGVTVLENSTYSDYWFVNDYNQSSFNFGLLGLFGGTVATALSIDFQCSLKIIVIPYSIDDYQDEIYSELVNIRQELEENGLLTEEIKDLLDSALYNVNNGLSVAEMLWSCVGYLQNLSSYTTVQFQAIQSCITELKSILSELKGQTVLLANILDYLRNGSEYQEEIDNFETEVNGKIEEMNGSLSVMNGVNKPSFDEVNPNINSQLPNDSSGYIQRIFDCIYCFEMPIGMLVLLFSFVLISYVLYGKKG